MTNFTHFGLPAALIESLERMQITTPTPVQEATIPIAMSGADILASAQTGTGKTVAYSIPLIINLLNNPESSALILAPTRELAEQVQRALNQLIGRSSRFRAVLLIGGVPMFRQMKELKRGAQIIVGTPGRITDHLMRGSLVLNKTSLLVIDEADRMLDMGFGVQLEKIAEFLPQERQTLMFSATLPPNIEKLSKKYLRNPQRVTINPSVLTTPKIKQELIHVGGDKFSQLLKQLEQREGSIIIFVKTKRSAERICRELQDLDHSTNAIHGDLKQRQRDAVIQGFRSNKNRILVATDIAARGLDIPHVMHVINYDLPQSPEDYVHRIGRTGRAGAEGNALSLVSRDDMRLWKAIARLIDPEAAKQAEGKRQEFSSKADHSEPKRYPKRQQPRGRFSDNRGFGEKRFSDRGPAKSRFKDRSFSKGPRSS